jgi:hypothetical protein
MTDRILTDKETKHSRDAITLEINRLLVVQVAKTVSIVRAETARDEVEFLDGLLLCPASDIIPRVKARRQRVESHYLPVPKEGK